MVLSYLHFDIHIIITSNYLHRNWHYIKLTWKYCKIQIIGSCKHLSFGSESDVLWNHVNIYYFSYISVVLAAMIMDWVLLYWWYLLSYLFKLIQCMLHALGVLCQKTRYWIGSIHKSYYISEGEGSTKISKKHCHIWFTYYFMRGVKKGTYFDTICLMNTPFI